MQIAAPKGLPVCRMRLEARWQDDGTADGEVTQELFWIDQLDEKIDDDHRHAVSPVDRGLIQLYYTPASRDAGAQIRATTGALAARLLRAIEWSKGTRDTIHAATKKLAEAFNAEAAIEAFNISLSNRWDELEESETDTDPGLTLISQRFEEVVAKIQVLFAQGLAEIQRGLEVLSDGQRSLFYFALAAAVFDLERDAAAGKIKGFRADELSIPALSIFAIEEPENHLSPYYLSRIVRQVRSIIKDDAAQALVTSHSPAVLSRVEPAEVRYCRCDPKTRMSTVRPIGMPSEPSDVAKFVRGAMLVFPELYFARFVILVEGDSERVVLPRLAEAEGIILDPSFVAVVPLGGRHVQHFWRLLNGLAIPHATLLDLDLGRSGGGFGRVKTTIGHLIEEGTPREQLLTLEDGKVLSPEQFEAMSRWDSSNAEALASWVADLRNYAIFFSEPLDLDMSMLAAFPTAYEKNIPAGGGPKMAPEEAAKVALGESGPGLEVYKDALADFVKYMPAYRYHFLTRSKPATHLQAFVHLDDTAIKKGMPETYHALVEHVRVNLKPD